MLFFYFPVLSSPTIINWPHTLRTGVAFALGSAFSEINSLKNSQQGVFENSVFENEGLPNKGILMRISLFQTFSQINSLKKSQRAGFEKFKFVNIDYPSKGVSRSEWLVQVQIS